MRHEGSLDKVMQIQKIESQNPPLKEKSSSKRETFYWKQVVGLTDQVENLKVTWNYNLK